MSVADKAVGAENPACSVAVLLAPDRFEDFFDKISVSLEDFRDRLTGGWLFNYVQALDRVGVRPVLYLISARVPGVLRFRHGPTGVAIRVMRTPWLHRKLQGARDRFRIESHPMRSLLSAVATPWSEIARELRRDACAAILCQEYESPRFDEAVVLGGALRIPVFATYQGANAPASVVEVPFRHLALRLAAGLIIGSQSEMQRVRATYGVSSSRLAFIPNALDINVWRPGNRDEARAAVGIPTDALVVVWHGRVDIHQKGLDILLDAWERLLSEPRSPRPYLLLLIGSGPDSQRLHRRVGACRPGTIRWRDVRVHDPHTIRQHLVAADVATLPSRSEGFAVSVIEALACGLPVVATDVSGVPEALGEGTGVIVPREDAARLADALGRLLADESLRRQLGDRARRRAQNVFSLDVVGQRLRAFMELRGTSFG